MLAECDVQYMMYVQMRYAVGGACTPIALNVVGVAVCLDVSSQGIIVFLFWYCTC